jgi:hypothetical protein
MASIETCAGIVRILEEEKPYSPVADSIGLKGAGDGFDRAYLITLERKGDPSEDEMALGYANVVDWAVGQLSRNRSHGAKKALRGLGFGDRDRFAHIDKFFPLIEAPELKMNGIGAAVLLRISGELESEGIRGAFTTNVSDEMEGFLKHIGFRMMDGVYLRTFEEPDGSAFHLNVKQLTSASVL